MAAALLDAAKNILVTTGWQDICIDFHRIHPVTWRCLQSEASLEERLTEEKYAQNLVCITDVTEQKGAREGSEVLHTHLAACAIELEVANNELEAFNYSLSHDLKNPLTAIHGVVYHLVNNANGKLDGKERSYLLAILDGCAKIDGLLTAMLTLSRVSRSELVQQEPDSSGLARKITLGLRMDDQERCVEFVIPPGISA